VTRGGAGSARRYARALLDVATEKKQEEPLRAEIEAMAALIAGHRDLAGLLSHPAVSAERKRKLAGAVAERAGASELMRRLLALLGERDRLALLPDIGAAYVSLLNARRGVVAAEAVSATPLDEAQARAVTEALASLTGREVALTSRVDPALRGGMLVKMEGRTYDGSVRARLAALRHRLSGADGAARAAAE
jgi:F-type H+-transporting ATPase subunit delta